MKLGMALIAGTVMLLTGCGVADQYSALPKVFREPGVEPPPPEPEPDVKELVRVGADTLFTGHPSALEVSRPRRIAGRGFDVCVKAVVPGAVDGQPRPVTVLVTIEHGKLADRHRATAQDRCAERYLRTREALAAFPGWNAGDRSGACAAVKVPSVMRRNRCGPEPERFPR